MTVIVTPHDVILEGASETRLWLKKIRHCLKEDFGMYLHRSTRLLSRDQHSFDYVVKLLSVDMEYLDNGNEDYEKYLCNFKERYGSIKDELLSKEIDAWMTKRLNLYLNMFNLGIKVDSFKDDLLDLKEMLIDGAVEVYDSIVKAMCMFLVNVYKTTTLFIDNDTLSIMSDDDKDEAFTIKEICDSDNEVPSTVYVIESAMYCYVSNMDKYSSYTNVPVLSPVPVVLKDLKILCNEDVDVNLEDIKEINIVHMDNTFVRAEFTANERTVTLQL